MAGNNITRRTVAKGMAWSVPAVAVAAAAPAFAASKIITVEAVGSACKHPGNPKWYHFTFAFTNGSGVDVTVTLTSMVVNGVSRPTSPSTITANANSTTCYYIDGGLFDDSANGTATLNFEYQDTNGETVSGSITTSFNDLPPCGTGADPGGNPQSNPPHANGGLTACS